MQEEFTAPGKEVLFTWIEVSGRLEFVCGFDEFSVLLIDLTKQVVQFACVLLRYKSLDNLPGLGEVLSQKVGLGQIVSVVVRGRIDLLGPFEKRARIRKLA